MTCGNQTKKCQNSCPSVCSKKNPAIKKVITTKKYRTKRVITGKKCSCPVSVCPTNAPKLEVEPVQLDFSSSDDPKAKFTLGRKFGLQKIKIKATSTQSAGQTVEKFNRKTNFCGNFKFPLPDNTIALTAVITVQVPSSFNQCGNPHCCVKTVYSGGEYNNQMIYRSYDGSANNLYHPQWGAAHQPLLRQATPAYADDISSLAERGISNPSPRVVSNSVHAQSGSVLNSLHLTDMTWMWGQFLDHEIDLTSSGSTGANIPIGATGVDPNEIYPNRTILFNRSKVVPNTAPLEQPNEISAYVDASNVYGYSATRALALRRLDGTGKLKTSVADNNEVILPYNVDVLANETGGSSDATSFFIAGDVRANENVNLTAIHTLFVREHNRLCDEIVAENPDMVGNEEMIFQHARRRVSALMQQITYEEFLPALLGDNALTTYVGHDVTVNAGINTEFSTVGYRLGHTMLSSSLKVGTSGSISLKDGFFTPSYIQANGADALLQGGANQVMQEIDGQIVDDVRNFLFGPPTATHLLDLATLNIQRGRDHGIPDYNTLRVAYGLPAVTTYAQITSDITVQGKLASLYGSVDAIDPWTGAILEDHVTGAGVGALVLAILKDQFERLRDGDRYWFEIDLNLSQEEIEETRNTRLSDVIIRNTSLTTNDISADVFHLLGP